MPCAARVPRRQSGTAALATPASPPSSSQTRTAMRSRVNRHATKRMKHADTPPHFPGPGLARAQHPGGRSLTRTGSRRNHAPANRRKLFDTHNLRPTPGFCACATGDRRRSVAPPALHGKKILKRTGKHYWTFVPYWLQWRLTELKRCVTTLHEPLEAATNRQPGDVANRSWFASRYSKCVSS
jgi:hypothetical protein